MRKKKTAKRSKAHGRGTAAPRRGRKKPSAKRKTGARRAAASSRKKSPSRKRAGTAVKRKAPRAPSRSGVERSGGRLGPETWERGIGPESAGQSGDTEAISRDEIADSESVEELLEEGQSFEAGVISGVENAPDADQGEVRTREVPEDDVPQEYLDED